MQRRAAVSVVLVTSDLVARRSSIVVAELYLAET
jgi:hypothetical protein